MKIRTHIQTEPYCSVLPRLDVSYCPAIDYSPFLRSDPACVWVEIGWLNLSVMIILDL